MPPAEIGVVAFVGTLPLLLVALYAGRRAGWLDHPSPIKPHARAVPHTGGTAIAALLAVAAVVSGAPAGVAAGIVAIWGAGFVDDLRGLPASLKLVFELPAVVLGSLAIGLDTPATVASALLGLVLVNGFNVVDGLDGLAGGVALPSLIVLAAAPGWGGPLAAAGVGAVGAFLLLNLHPARLFMGDEGSLVLGYILWIVPLAFLRVSGGSWHWLPWLLLWAFPVVNAAFVIALRLRAKRSVLRGDRSHLYDALNRRVGLRNALLACWAIAAVGAVAAVAAG